MSFLSPYSLFAGPQSPSRLLLLYNPYVSGKRVRLTLIVVAAAVLSAVALWWALPRLVAAMPGRYLHYVPETIVEMVTTPLPTPLPPPSAPAPAALELALSTPTPATPTPTTIVPTPEVTPEAAADATNGPQRTNTPAPTATPEIPPTPTHRPLPVATRIDGLPIIPQKFNNCGPTNMTIVLNYYGVEVDQFDVAAVARPNYEDRNVSPDELVAYVNNHTDLRASHYVGGDVDLLRALLAAGLPVIIEKGLEPDATIGWMGHYLTVFGYDDAAGHLLVRDTYLGPWREDGVVSYEDTARYWSQFNGAFIVVYPPERAAELAQTLGPTFADARSMWAAAAERARASVRIAPEESFGWFNLGTSLTVLAGLNGDAAHYSAAAAAYDQARLLGLPARMMWYQFGPYEAYLASGRHEDVLTLVEATFAGQGGRNVEETYYYQGRALLMAGDEPGARAAFQRAVALNPASAVGRAAAAALGE